FHGPASELGFGVAQDLLEARREVDGALGQVPVPEAVVRAPGGERVALLAAADRGLRPLARRDGDRDRQQADLGPERDLLDGKERGARGPRTAAVRDLAVSERALDLEEPAQALALPGVDPEPELVNGAADDVLAAVAEAFQEGVVDLDEASV